jgi:hypothetical protein
MAKKRGNHPLDLKTGRAVFSPVLRSTGERLDLEVDYASFPRSKKLGFHGYTQNLKTGAWYAIYGKECDIPGCHCDAWVDELPGPPPDLKEPAGREQRGDNAFRGLSKELGEAIRALLTIEGVEGIGKPVTLISPADLPPDFLGFVERLRAGPIELDEEMLLITLAGSGKRGRRRKPANERVRQALVVLGRFALDQDMTTSDVMALFDEAKRKLSRSRCKPKRGWSSRR